ncbi:MAG: BBP7 family outer membrane beta-barrel protein [Planctomycetota bacterium]
MFGRMSFGSLFVLALLAPGVCWAQAGYGYGPPNGPTGPVMPPYQGQYAPPLSGAPCPDGGNSRTIFEEIPDDRGWLFDDSPLSKSIESSFRHAFFRTEYLLWSFSDPGRVVLGAPLLSGDDLRDPINVPVNDRVTGAPIGFGVVPTLDGIQFSGNNGFRGTFGMPVGPGAFEASAFIFATKTSHLNLTNEIQPLDPDDPFAIFDHPTFVAQPVLIEGAPSIESLVYTDSYQAQLTANAWGTEANYIFSPPNAGAGDFLTFSPLVGVRYFYFQERLNQTGVYQFSDDLVDFRPVTSRIDASTINNSYGPQIGFRTEVNISRLTLGAEPKVMLGFNSYQATLFTQNILSDAEPDLTIHDKQTTFGPLADVKLYSRLALSQNLHVFAAYNFMWAGMLTRPYNNVVYNISAPGGAGAFQQDVRSTDVILQGLSAGAEFRY